MSIADDLDRAKVRFSMTLHPLRQRAIVIGLLSALALGLLVMLALLIIGMWLDLTIPLSVGLRRLILLSTALTVVVSIILFARRARQDSSDEEIARHIDDVSDSGGTVMAGYDLLHHGVAQPNTGNVNEDQAEFSLGLAVLAADQAEKVCQDVDPLEVVSSRRAKVWWRNAAIATLAIAILAALVPRMAWTQAQRILIPMESQLPYSPTSLTVEPGDTEVLFGSDLEVLATIQGPPVEDLEMVLEFDDRSRETLPMLAETDDRWRTYLTRITQPADYFVRAEGARSRTHRLDVRMTPEIESIRCTVTPPEYANRSRYEGPLPDRGLQGLPGTKVSITMTSNRPLKRGTMQLDDGGKKQKIELTVTSTESEEHSQPASQTVRGEFQITHSGRYQLSLTDIEGTPSVETVEGTITMLHDEKPVIRLLQPRPVSLATPDIPLPIVVAAEDDYGLTRVELFRGLNQSPEMGTPLELESHAANVKIGTSLPLSSYGLQPGDEITLFARGEDNDPAGAKGAESPVATVRIISQQQLAELELSRRGMEAVLSKQRQAQRLTADLQEKLTKAKEKLDQARESQAEALKAREAGDPEAGEKQAAADKAMKEALDRMASAQAATAQAAESLRQSADVELPVDIDKGMNDQLKEMAGQLSRIAERMQQLVDKMKAGEEWTADETNELDDLMRQIDQMKQQHQESAMNPTERMSKILPLAADQRRFEQITRRQRSLSDRLDALQASDLADPTVQRRADDLRREQQQMQVALSQLLEDIGNHAKQLPDDPELDQLRQTATDFVDEVRSSQADPRMSETQQGLLDDDPVTASNGANKAAEILESFLSQCDSMGGQACENCEASFKPSAGSPRPGNSISQLLKQMGLGAGQSGMKSGMQPGAGPGMAAGGGYSMPQNTMDNIGVYGGLPVPQPKPRRGSGGKSDQSYATYSQGGKAAPATNGIGESADASARGDTGTVVPSVYRKQVSDYFRNLAEELGELE